ncbi:LOW QUALITY PROTEIN: hypothetical protein PHMEG_0009560 [Phytophthora megakarya]|uniref:Eukaryotic/viral aspartic protease n=1 Tax=Phytophthora megakarya TaxID=4795 RepID=A0A225WGU3_9STRA|nr:LOW QUALITY PROTEIN: hypothetical protein PHMEG_0009560 [Phytophthora megakarya]
MESAKRSKYCIYAYVNKATTDRGRKESDPRCNTCNLHSYAAKIASLSWVGEFNRFDAEVALDIQKRKIPGYWECHAPGKWFRQAKISGRMNQERAILLLDASAEVSVLDTTFARKVRCHFDTSQRQECVGIGDNITLAGYLVYFFDIWVGDLSGQNAILGMDFMVRAGVRMDLADGSLRLPDEVGIPLNGRKRLYGEKVRSVTLERSLRIPVGRSEETAAGVEIVSHRETVDGQRRTMGTDSNRRPRSDPLPGDLEYLRSDWTIVWTSE